MEKIIKVRLNYYGQCVISSYLPRLHNFINTFTFLNFNQLSMVIEMEKIWVLNTSKVCDK